MIMPLTLRLEQLTKKVNRATATAQHLCPSEDIVNIDTSLVMRNKH